MRFAVKDSIQGRIISKGKDFVAMPTSETSFMKNLVISYELIHRVYSFGTDMTRVSFEIIERSRNGWRGCFLLNL
jgi:hypothetical protein